MNKECPDDRLSSVVPRNATIIQSFLNTAGSAGGTPRSKPGPDTFPGEMVALPTGTFLMGESVDDKFATATERPRHHVVFSHRFALGKYPVTVGGYRRFSPNHALQEPAEWPVVNVSWEEAEAYCVWLCAATGLPWRLPSESEWEYACRGGTTTCFSTGEDLKLGDANFLYSEQGERVGVGSRQPVGSYPMKPYGLTDLHGNVCELMKDNWHPNFVGALADGRAWTTGGASDLRVIRGGAWDYLPRLLRSAWRDAIPKGQRRDNVGFRLALTLPADS